MFKVTSAQINPTIGDMAGNVRLMLDAARQARDQGSHLVVFPELSLTAYYPADLLDDEHFQERLENGFHELLTASRETPQLYWVVGAPTRRTGPGKPFHNSLLVVKNGAVVLQYDKQLLPTYNIFDERRHFEPGPDVARVLRIGGLQVGFLICEDGWNDHGQDYGVNPFQRLADAAPDLVVSINASPSNIGKREQRHEVFSKACARHNLPLLYVNQIGGHDQLVYDGASFAVDPAGHVVYEAQRFVSDVTTLTFDPSSRSFKDAHGQPLPAVSKEGLPTMEFYRQQIVLGLKDYARRCGFKQVVVGSSGGIDSALTLALAVEALGAPNVVGVTMPSKFSSEGSVSDSVQLCRNLGIMLVEHPIREVVSAYENSFSGAFGAPLHGLALENLQARVRGTTLMEFSNTFGHLLLTTGNKSEVSVGYCVAGTHYVQTDQGLISAEALHARLDKESFSIKACPITASAKRQHESYLEVETQWGHLLRVSRAHPMKVVDVTTGRTFFKAAGDLQEGDYLVQTTPFTSEGSPEPFGFQYQRSEWDFRSTPIQGLPTRISPTFARLLGVFVADGSYQGKGMYTVVSAKTEVLDWVGKTLDSFGVHQWNTRTKSRGGAALTISSVEFVGLLRDIGLPHLAPHKFVPDVILRGGSEIWAQFLAGVLLDSTTNKKKQTSEVCYHSVSRTLAYQVFMLLNALGVRCYFRQKPARANARALYEAYIPPSQVPGLAGVLKPSVDQVARDNSAQKARGSFDVLFSDMDSLRALSSQLPEAHRQTVRAALRDGRTWLSRNYLLMLAEREPTLRHPLIQAAKSGVAYAKVCRIQHVDTPEWMYDFQVEGLQEFSIDGIQVHNCTLYGDTNGGLGLIGDLYKTEIFELCRHINASAGREIIPVAIIDKPPSAELAPGQRDTDSLPPYEVLDEILKHLIEGPRLADWERKKSSAEVAALRATPEGRELVERIQRMIARNEYKRRQAPPVLRVRGRAFGSGRQVPIASVQY